MSFRKIKWPIYRLRYGEGGGKEGEIESGREDGGDEREHGSALLFLSPSELGFLKYLKELKVPLEEYEFPK